MGSREQRRGAVGIAPYGADAVVLLSSTEAIRRRPAMYVGSSGRDGLHKLLFEVVDNSVDEALAGFCNEIRVSIGADGTCTVEDDGRGVPTEIHPGEGRPLCELLFTRLHAGGKFGNGAYDISTGLHGVGVACVNALSEFLELDIERDGHRWRQTFRRGIPDSQLTRVGEGPGSGTRVRFRPDPQIFGDATIWTATVVERLRELAYLIPGLTLRLADEANADEQCFEQHEGPAGLALELARGRRLLHTSPLAFDQDLGGVRVRGALVWTDGYSEAVASYANYVRTGDGGSHLEGLHDALVRCVNEHAAQKEMLGGAPEDEIPLLDIVEGLAGVLGVEFRNPEFEGQTKSRLRAPHVRGIVASVAHQAISEALQEDPRTANAIVFRALEAARARRSARLASERAYYRGTDTRVDPEIYRTQFRIRSGNWHESATWITHEELLRAHGDMCAVGPDARLLDVCCGSGVVGAAFGDRVARKTGLDLTPEMAAMAKDRLDEVRLGNVYSPPFPDETFDIVVTREVLHLLPLPHIPVANIHRMLRPGGQVVIGHIFPFGRLDASWMWRIFKKKQPLVFNMFLEEDFRALLEGAGFTDVTTRELLVWESIDRWIDTHETSAQSRQEIRRLYHEAPEAVREVHPFEVLPSGEIRDCWRWCVFSAFKAS